MCFLYCPFIDFLKNFLKNSLFKLIRSLVTVPKKSWKRDYIKYMLLCSKKCIKNLSRTSCTFIQILNCNIVLMMGSAAKIKIWKYSQRIKKNKTKQDKKTSGSVGPKFFWLTWALRSSQHSYSKYQKYSFDITEKKQSNLSHFCMLMMVGCGGEEGDTKYFESQL